ncbi:MAG: lysylphosphatidylglycerol synthase transmembrane domain-containing protein [Candidatus Paracaedibacter sp.]
MVKASASSFSIPWGTLLKILVSGALIFWLLNKIDITKVWEVIQHLHGGILALVLVFIWLTLFAIAKRWQLIVRLGGVNASFPNLTKATFIGAFFNQFLPSSVGGDFFRVLAVRRHGASLTEAVTGVFMDRLFGFISLGVLCALVVPSEGQLLINSDLKWPFLATMFLLLSVFGGGSLLLLIPKTWYGYAFIRPFSALIEMTRRAFSQKVLFLAILLASLTSSIFLISGLQVLMVAFNIPLTWGQGVVILPVVLLLTSLPISFAGWGLREGAMMIALGIYGVPAETALALALVYGVLHLVSGLPGLVLWVLEKRRLQPNSSATSDQSYKIS